jgi:hypothetical protein
MKTLVRWLQFLRPSVQRDLVALVIGCPKHAANRFIRRGRQPFYFGLPGQSLPLACIANGSCVACLDLYAAKQRVKALLS